MCFEMEGIQANYHEIEEERMIEVEEEEKLGPMIICVDTSRSMQGSPETIAKAVTLFIATRAVSQKRNCLLINFSTSIETLDLSGKIGIAKAIEFLQCSFHGGTDASPAFEYALEMMSKKPSENSGFHPFCKEKSPDSSTSHPMKNARCEGRLTTLEVVRRGFSDSF